MKKILFTMLMLIQFANAEVFTLESIREEGKNFTKEEILNDFYNELKAVIPYQIDRNTQYAKVVKLKDGIYLTKMIDWDVYSQILKGNGVEQKNYITTLANAFHAGESQSYCFGDYHLIYILERGIEVYTNVVDKNNKALFSYSISSEDCKKFK